MSDGTRKQALEVSLVQFVNINLLNQLPDLAFSCFEWVIKEIVDWLSHDNCVILPIVKVTPVDFSESEVQCSFASFNVVREESIFLIMTDACPPVHLAVMTVFKKVFCLLHNLQVLVFSLTGGSRSPTPIFKSGRIFYGFWGSSLCRNWREEDPWHCTWLLSTSINLLDSLLFCTACSSVCASNLVVVTAGVSLSTDWVIRKTCTISQVFDSPDHNNG